MERAGAVADEVRAVVQGVGPSAVPRACDHYQRCRWRRRTRRAWIEDERTVLEFKSFTTVGGSRRTQIKRSLARAAEHQPLRWILIAPIDPTPSGWDWFEQLQTRYPFELVFRELAWLNEQMAANPDIARYIAASTEEHVLGLLRELNAERAALAGGVPDLANRVATLQERGDEASVFWALDFAGRADHTVVTVRPKPGAPPDNVRVELAIPQDDPEAIAVARMVEQALLYGGAVVVEPQYIARIDSDSLRALNLPEGHMGMVMPANPMKGGLPLPAILRVRSADRQPQSPALHITFDEGAVGERGGTLRGRDSTGLVRVRLLVDHPGPNDQFAPVRSLALEYGDGDPHTARLSAAPESLLRTVDALAAMDSAHQLELTITGQTIITEGRELRIATGHFAGLADLLRDLVYVRDSLGIPLLVPGNWSGADQVAIRRAARLLRGHEVPLPIDTLSQVVSPEEAQALLDVLLPNGALLDTELVDYTLTFSDNILPIAPLYARMSRVALDNSADIMAALDRGDEEIPIKLVAWPGSNAVCRMMSFTPDTKPDDQSWLDRPAHSRRVPGERRSYQQLATSRMSRPHTTVGISHRPTSRCHATGILVCPHNEDSTVCHLLDSSISMRRAVASGSTRPSDAVSVAPRCGI